MQTLWPVGRERVIWGPAVEKLWCVTKAQQRQVWVQAGQASRELSLPRGFRCLKPMFPKGAVTATAPLSSAWPTPSSMDSGAGCWTFPPWQGWGTSHCSSNGRLKPWEHASAGTPWSWGPKLPACGEEWSVSAPPSTPKLSSHPGAPRLHPTHSTLVPSPAPCCPHGPQHPQGQALVKEASDLQHFFSVWINKL